MIFATNNIGKLEEIKDILKGYDIKSLADIGVDIEVVEDGKTFYANALKKAKEISELIHEDVIADDSGICIDFLDGKPGVHTKRFLGKDRTNYERNEHLLSELRDVPKEKRGVSILCVLVYYSKDGTIAYGEGSVRANIATSQRGNNGFGFDSIIETEDGRTWAELPNEEKNKISHRRLAAEDLVKKINEINK